MFQLVPTITNKDEYSNEEPETKEKYSKIRLWSNRMGDRPDLDAEIKGAETRFTTGIETQFTPSQLYDANANAPPLLMVRSKTTLSTRVRDTLTKEQKKERQTHLCPMINQKRGKEITTQGEYNRSSYAETVSVRRKDLPEFHQGSFTGRVVRCTETRHEFNVLKMETHSLINTVINDGEDDEDPIRWTIKQGTFPNFRYNRLKGAVEQVVKEVVAGDNKGRDNYGACENLVHLDRLRRGQDEQGRENIDFWVRVEGRKSGIKYPVNEVVKLLQQTFVTYEGVLLDNNKEPGYMDLSAVTFLHEEKGSKTFENFQDQEYKTEPYQKLFNTLTHQENLHSIQQARAHEQEQLDAAVLFNNKKRRKI